MSEVAPDLHVGPTPEQASVELSATAPVEAAAPAVDESAQASPAPSADAAPAAATDPMLQELDDMRSRFEAVLAENAHLKEQLALHAASNAVDAVAALKQIAALAAPFA